MIHTTILEPAEIHTHLDSILSDVKFCAIDTETNSKDVRDGRGFAAGMSFAYRNTEGLHAFYIPFWHQYGPNYPVNEFKDQIQRIIRNKKILYHNAKFDLVSQNTLGLDIDYNTVDFYCTMVMAHLIDENMKWYGGYGLDVLGKRWLKNDGKIKSKGLSTLLKEDATLIPSFAIAEYASVDTVLTHELFEYEYPKMKAENLMPVYMHKREFTKLLIRMEGKGIRVDTELSQREINKGSKIMGDIKESLAWRNPLSPKDLKFLLNDELELPVILNRKTGRPTYDKDAMDEYEIMLEHLRNPIAQKILRFRGWNKTISSNYDAYLRFLSPDGNLRCNYKQHGTVTGRLSCELPNLQQIPRESAKEWNGHLKSAFLPDDSDSALLEFDYSQLELRLATAYANEQALIKVFQEGRDIFAEMATTLRQGRQDTKTMVYAIQYGAGTNRISNVLGVSSREASARIDNYYANYPGFRKVSTRVQAIVQRHKKAPLWSGRFRHFQYTGEAYKAFNSLMQGGGADVLERVMVRVDKEIPEADIRLTVHDSLISQIKRKDIERIVPEIKRIMEDVNGSTGMDFPVPFATEVKEWGKAA